MNRDAPLAAFDGGEPQKSVFWRHLAVSNPLAWPGRMLPRKSRVPRPVGESVENPSAISVGRKAPSRSRTAGKPASPATWAPRNSTFTERSNRPEALSRAFDAVSSPHRGAKTFQPTVIIQGIETREPGIRDSDRKCGSIPAPTETLGLFFR